MTRPRVARQATLTPVVAVTLRKVARRLRRAVKRRLRGAPAAEVKRAPAAKKAAKAAKPAEARQKARAKEPQPAPLDPVVTEVRRRKLTYLPVGALNDLYEAARAADAQQRPGILLEAGCALGGSAVVLATAKVQDRPLHVHDVFGMIPPPTDEDGEDIHRRYETIASGKAVGIGGDPYYGYEEDLVTKVDRTFTELGVPTADNAVRLVQGLFQDTITGDEPVAVAHIDGDWYESVRTCLNRIGPRLPSGGVMVIDDYDYWSGCRTAVDEFLAEHPDEYRTVRRTRLHIEKV